jgi:hypothetical protein
MHAPRHRRRLVSLLVLLLTLTVGVPAVLADAATARAETATAAAAQVTWAAGATRPFSDPVWLPLRKPARVSCVHSNPGCSDYHGYWALDLLANRGDPVYAAGAGVFHIGAQSAACSTTGSQATGTWVWVDHGGGVVTKYTHLDGITAREGQLVTPSTRIGTVGHSGDVLPCTTNYLHFEVRTGGIKGTRVNPRTLYGCEGTTRRSYPGVWGYKSWNDVPKVARSTPALGNGCLPASTGTTSPPATVSGARGDGTAKVSWTVPTWGSAKVNRYVISQELWGPSFNGWHQPTYRTVAATQRTTTFTGLDNGRRYRYRVLAHDSTGNSAWTRYVEVVPAAAPLAPATDRAQSSGTSYVRFGWWNATARGATVSSYTAAIRRGTGNGWTAWTFVEVPGDVRTHRWDGLRPGTTYQVTVRANSTAGSSPWGVYRKIRTTSG